MAVKCSNLIYTPSTSLAFTITGATKSLIPHSSDNLIHSVEGPGGLHIQTGLTLEVKKVMYKINFIEHRVVNGRTIYTLSTAKPTRASTFITPMIGEKKEEFFWDRLFMNCFISTEQDGYCIALLFRWSGDPLFLKFESSLSKMKNFKRMYDPSTNTVMFIFNIDPSNAKDYNCFITGKYSEMSTTYKRRILDFHGIGRHSEVGQILYKAPERRKSLSKMLGIPLDANSELLSIINEETESFDEAFYNCKPKLR